MSTTLRAIRMPILLIVLAIAVAAAAATGPAFGQTESQNVTLQDIQNPRAAWSDGSIIWLINSPDGNRDSGEDTLYAHSAVTGGAMTDRDIELAPGNHNPIALWSDGAILLVTDTRAPRIFGYNLSDGSRHIDSELTLGSRNDDPRAIWSDGETIYVADSRDTKAYAYSVSAKTRQSDRDIDFPNDIVVAGLTSHGATMWVLDADDRELNAYNLDSGSRQLAGDIALRSGNQSPVGLWSNDEGIYVVDSINKDIHQYDLPAEPNNGATGQPEIHGIPRVGQVLTADTSGIEDANGIPENGITLQWLRDGLEIFNATAATHTLTGDDQGRTVRVRADFTDNDGHEESTISESTAAVAGELELLNLDPNNQFPTGIWSDGDTAWVTDLLLNIVFAYDLSTGEPNANKAFTLAAPTAAASGIWSDGTTAWVSRVDGRLEARTLSNHNADTAKDITLASENDDVYDLWSDGATVWVLDATDEKLYAYALDSGERRTGRDIGLDNNHENPWGVWSDGFTIWVTDGNAGKAFGYWLIDGTRSPDSDFDLDGENENAAGMWSNQISVAVLDPGDGRTYTYQLPDWVSSPAEGAPSITGTPEIEGTLTADTADIFDRNTIPDGAFIYQWYLVDGETETAIDGATGPTYSPTRDDAGKRLRVVITYTDANNHPEGPLRSELSGRITGTLDFTTLSAAGNNDPKGAWANGATVWIADSQDNKLYAYSTADASRDADKDIALHSTNDRAWGVWSDGTTVWVSDQGREKLFAYNLSSGERQEDLEIALASDGSQAGSEQNYRATGIWPDGATIWVGDHDDGKLYAYLLADGARRSSEDINTRVSLGSQNPQGLWSDGTTMWSVDYYDDEINSFWMFDRALDRGISVRLPSTRQKFEHRGTWSDGETIWVVDDDADRAQAYNLPDRRNRGVTGRPAISGIPRVGETLTAGISTVQDANRIPDGSMRYQWVAIDNGNASDIDGATAATYTPGPADAGKTLKLRVNFTDGDGNAEAPGASDSTEVIAKTGVIVTLGPAGNTQPWGITSDQTTLWVTDTGSNSVYSYTLADETAAPDGDFELTEGNASPRGAWSNDETIYVADGDDSKLYAYNMDGTRGIGKDVALDTDNSEPTGVWGNASIIWVADGGDDKLYAYHPDGLRYPGKDIALTADNTDPMGIWSNGYTMWVTDAEDAKAYAYRLRDGTQTALLDISLQARNANPAGAWGDGITLHVADRMTGRIYPYELPTVANLQADGLPVITGVIKVGTEVHADTSGISDGNGIPRDAFQYQWYLVLGTLNSATEISGATNRAYTPRDDQIGRFLQVRVSFRDAEGFEETLTSAVSDIILDADVPSAPNVVENALVIVWEAPDQERGATGYQILRKERHSNEDYTVLVEDTGTTDTHHRDTTAEYGVEYAYVVHALNENGVGPRSNELYAVRVRANRPGTGMLLIGNSPEVDQTLLMNSRNIQDEDGIDRATNKSIRWFADNVRISGANSGSYIVRESDLGKTIRVEIHLTDNRGFREAFTSAETAPVFEVVVWKTTMTVGSAPDTDGRTFLGYLDIVYEIGSLDEKTFTLDGQENAVRSLFHHHNGDELRMTVTNPLDDRLTLHVGSHRFKFNDADSIVLSHNVTRGYIFNLGSLILVPGTNTVVKIK